MQLRKRRLKVSATNSKSKPRTTTSKIEGKTEAETVSSTDQALIG